MSNFEILLIVMLCAVPVFALFMVLPKIKLKKKEKKTQEPLKTYTEIKKEEPQTKAQEEPKVQDSPKTYLNQDISPEEFRGYLKERKTTKPNRIEHPADFKDMSMPYMPRNRRLKEQKQPQSVAEEIKGLSPELKAMLIAGVLDKKY